MDKEIARKYIKQYGMGLFLRSRIYSRLHLQEKLHHTYRSYLEKKYRNIIEKYCNTDSVLSPDAAPACKRVWVLWWQGVETMPEVVKCCYRSILQHTTAYDEVVVLTRDNYNEYAKLPRHIVDRFEAGDMGIAALSDIMRIYLLSQYGGIWLDATVFLSDDLPEEYTDRAFFSSNTGNRTSAFASRGRWAGYFMGVSHSHTVLFDYLREICTEYWKEHNIILTYFLLDYLLLIAHDDFEPIGRLIDEIPINNVNAKKLSAVLNDPFDAEKWESIRQGTVFHKLSWKREFYLQKDGQETFYGRLLANDRNDRPVE